MPPENDDRTEPATQKRREETREKGHVPKSRELTSVAVLVAGVVYFHFFSGYVGERMAAIARYFFQAAVEPRDASAEAYGIILAALRGVGWAILPLLGIVLAFGIFADIYFYNRHKNERRFLDLLEYAPDGLLLVNSRGEIELVNSQLEEMTGYRRDELMGQKVEILIHEDISNSEFGSNELAKKLHISESQLYRKTKAITGKSTAVFIRSIRLQYAKDLLLNSDKTVSEETSQLGKKPLVLLSKRN